MSYQKRRIEAGEHRRKLSNQIRGSRRLSSLPFELSLESSSEVDKFQRSQDRERQKEFNKEVRDWSNKSTSVLKGSVSRLIKRNVSLSASIKANLYYDRKYASEVNRVGFSFVREGIYIHKGAGRGQGGHIGGRWIDRYGNQKTRAEESAGKQGKGNRQPILWFDPVIDNRLPQLADLVADYSATMQINATNLFID